MNVVWLGLMTVGFVFAVLTGHLADIGNGAVDQAKAAVELALGLVGVMALWLGVMRVAEASGLIRIVSRGIYPLARLLFPAVPKDHPALSAITLNVAANALGLSNAATPFGVKAMEALESLNPKVGVPSDAQATFVALNTANVQLVPATMIALRAAAHSKDPSEIVGPTLLATLIAMAVGLVSVRLLARLPRFRREYEEAPDKAASAPTEVLAPVEPVAWTNRSAAALAAVGALGLLACVMAGRGYAAENVAPGAVGALRVLNAAISRTALPLMLVGIPLFAFAVGVPAYERFIEGAKEGFALAIRVLPYLLAILVAVGLFRSSGAMGAVARGIGPLTNAFGLPPEALPMVLVRPMSGSAANGVAAAVFADPALGPDSYVGRLVSVMSGSTETTFYVLAIYFGAVGLRRFRHALWAGLLADAAGFIASIVVVQVIFGR